MREQVDGSGRWRLFSLGGLVLVFSLCALPTELRAQEAAIASVGGLQNAPAPESAAQAPESQVAPSQSSATLSGTVRDIYGAVIPGISVKLIGPDAAVRTVSTDSIGAYTFAELAPGTYQVKFSAAGVEPSAAASVVLAAGEKHELPLVAIRIPTKNTTINVVATTNEVAEAQVKQEEEQRVLGLVPNFYTSYIWNAAPIKSSQKFHLVLRSSLDPFTFVVAAGVAGAEQAHNTFPGYGRGWEGYAKRYGGSYADTVTHRLLSSAIFPVVLHQDPRYYYQGSGTVRSRILHALISTVICKGDNGQPQPNYSQVLGNFAAAGISNLYRAPMDRQASLTFRNGLIITGTGAIENLMREFLSRKLTPNVPSFANGKP